MIPVKKEPQELYLNTKVYEKCFFCKWPTPYWHEDTNNAVCQECAKNHKVSELIDWYSRKVTNKQLKDRMLDA